MEEENQKLEEQEPSKKKKNFPWEGFWIWTIAIIILGVLSAIAIPNMIYARRKAITSSCPGNLRNMGIIITKYSTDHKGHYPQNLEVLTKKGYIEKLPVCPLTGESYILEIHGWDDTSFTLKCPNIEKHIESEGPNIKRESFYYKAGQGAIRVDS